VVGVDGSASSKTALGWAIRQARLTDAGRGGVLRESPPGPSGRQRRGLAVYPAMNGGYDPNAALLPVHGFHRFVLV
jgi:hypothetical protein